MDIPPRRLFDYVWVLVRGMAMGAADVVPGVSGGTIAFITGIYDELLYSLSQLTPKLLLVIKNEGIASAWQRANGSFLLALFSGVLISVFSLARLISWSLEMYPTVVWSFFVGLILASVIYLFRQQRSWRGKQWLACAAGAILVYGTSIVSPAQLPGEPWILFLGGMVAICAMILPGISGSFLLLLMGLYPVVIRAVSDFDLIAVASVGLGCVVGLLAFSRLLSWLLQHHHTTTFATLIGFLIGSLNVTWPWKHTLETTLNSHGELIPLVRENVLPWNYLNLTAEEPRIILALAFFILAVLLVLCSEFIYLKIKKSTS